MFFLYISLVQMVKIGDLKEFSLVFCTHFPVCFKCKIRFRTYGIHRNIQIWASNFKIPRAYLPKGKV